MSHHLLAITGSTRVRYTGSHPHATASQAKGRGINNDYDSQDYSAATTSPVIDIKHLC